MWIPLFALSHPGPVTLDKLFTCCKLLFFICRKGLITSSLQSCDEDEMHAKSPQDAWHRENAPYLLALEMWRRGGHGWPGSCLLRTLKGHIHIFLWEGREPARAVWGKGHWDTIYTILSVLSWGTERKHIESKISLGASTNSCRHLSSDTSRREPLGFTLGP